MNNLLEELDQLREDEEDEDLDAPFPVQAKEANPMWQSAKRWKFTPGRMYEFRNTERKQWGSEGSLQALQRARFLRDVGVNHLFQRRKGWYTCWTDNQLVGWDVKEIRG